MSQTNPIARYRAAAARMREIEAAGTKGPWEKFIGGNFTEVLCGPRQDDPANRVCVMRSYNPASEHVFGEDYEVEHKNARLICASRNLLLPLLDAGDKLAWACQHPTRRIQPKDGAPYVVIAIDPIAQAELLVALAALTDALERECGGAA